MTIHWSNFQHKTLCFTFFFLQLELKPEVHSLQNVLEATELLKGRSVWFSCWLNYISRGPHRGFMLPCQPQMIFDYSS